MTTICHQSPQGSLVTGSGHLVGQVVTKVEREGVDELFDC